MPSADLALPVQMACLYTHRRLQDPKIRIFMDHVCGRVAAASDRSVDDQRVLSKP